MIHRHYCKTCTTRIEAGDNGYCIACVPAIREALNATSKEMVLREANELRQRYLATDRAPAVMDVISRLVKHPWDDASAFAEELRGIVEGRGKRESIFHREYTSGFPIVDIASIRSASSQSKLVDIIKAALMGHCDVSNSHWWWEGAKFCVHLIAFEQHKVSSETVYRVRERLISMLPCGCDVGVSVGNAAGDVDPSLARSKRSSGIVS